MHPAVALATLGVGFLPRAPGTWGSLLALVVWWFVPALHSTLVLGVAAGIALVLGVVVIGQIMRRFGVLDAGEIVIDEVVGMWIALLWAPAVWWVAIVAFAAFRLFDIAKPWPVSWADAQHTPLGVMLDDVLAGLMALGVVQVVILIVL